MGVVRSRPRGAGAKRAQIFTENSEEINDWQKSIARMIFTVGSTG